LVGPRLM